MTASLLTVESLTKRYIRDGREISAVDYVSFHIAPGETFAICGPSGSGKSTIARLVAGLIQPDAGHILLKGQPWSGLSASALRPRRRHLQMVFQDPNAAFNPRATVETAISDPLRIHNIVPPANRYEEVARLMHRVGLSPDLLQRRRHEISGGQRQRVAIARALASRPDLLVLDEATSALDTTVRASILNLLVELQRELGIAYLLISHDIALVRSVAHRVAILDHGRIVETGDAVSVIDNPQSEIGKALVAATPRLLEPAS